MSGRYTVEPSDGLTECECPEALCTHADGMRAYRAWTVWDNERDEHAFITSPSARLEPEYMRKRDAVAALARLDAEVTL